MNNRGVGLGFHRLKSSEGEAAVLRGVCICWWAAPPRPPQVCWELGQDRGPWMNCVPTHTVHLATGRDVWVREGRVSKLQEVLLSGCQAGEGQASSLLPVKDFRA